MDVNESGVQPVHHKVLVMTEEIEEKTEGGIYIPQTTRDNERMAQVRAELVAIGGNAFDDWREPKPQIGQRIYVAKYAGIRFKGDDDRYYQLIYDNDIVGIIKE